MASIGPRGSGVLQNTGTESEQTQNKDTRSGYVHQVVKLGESSKNPTFICICVWTRYKNCGESAVSDAKLDVVQQSQSQIEIPTTGQGLYEFTGQVTSFVHDSGILTGQITVYCRHTSASLTIQENADRDVQVDLNGFFSRLVPEGMDWLRHTSEGPDDMPAHIKSALTDVSLTIPIADGSIVLGTWQGIYLFEHRHRAHRRRIVLHVVGE